MSEEQLLILGRQLLNFALQGIVLIDLRVQHQRDLIDLPKKCTEIRMECLRLGSVERERLEFILVPFQIVTQTTIFQIV